MSASSQMSAQPEGNPQGNPQQQQTETSGTATSGTATSSTVPSGTAPSSTVPSGTASSVTVPSSTAPSSSVPSVSVPSGYSLVAPIMGGLEYVSTTDQMAWTGGKPNITWTGLDASASSSPSDWLFCEIFAGEAGLTTAM